MDKKGVYFHGMKDGIPVGLGYFAVGFTLGIAARAVGITPLQMGLMSFTMHASAGQFAVLTIIAGQSGYVAMIFTQLVVNIRYLLMSCALTQKIDAGTSLPKRLLLSYFVTDEIFGLSSGVKGRLDPLYSYGIATVASPGWVGGTVLGVVAGNILPPGLSSALGVALYCMFLSVVVPASRTDKAIAIVVIVSMLGSSAFEYIPVLCEISMSTRIIILTLAIAAAAAIIKPVPASASTRDGDDSQPAEADAEDGREINAEDGGEAEP